MIRITISKDGEIIQQVEGEAVIGFIRKPNIAGSNAATFMIGEGRPADLLTTAGKGLGALLSNIVDDQFRQAEIYVKMTEAMKDGIRGDDVEVNHKRVEPIHMQED